MSKPIPFLKWVGGKGQLLAQFQPFLPPSFNCYYEPFLGGGAMFFSLEPKQAVLNDLNPHLIAAYQHVKEQLEPLLEQLSLLRANYKHEAQTYYELRKRYNRLETPSLEKSALLILLNKTGYNGLYRESKKSGYNVPFGRYSNPTLYDEANLRVVSKSLQNSQLTNLPFSEAVQSARQGDFVYFDPPYVPSSKTANFTAYTTSGFGEAEQIKLANLAQELTERGIWVMLSNSYSECVIKLYPKFYHQKVKANRSINSKAALRSRISELVITNYHTI